MGVVFACGFAAAGCRFCKSSADEYCCSAYAPDIYRYSFRGRRGSILGADPAGAYAGMPASGPIMQPTPAATEPAPMPDPYMSPQPGLMQGGSTPDVPRSGTPTPLTSMPVSRSGLTWR